MCPLYQRAQEGVSLVAYRRRVPEARFRRLVEIDSRPAGCIVGIRFRAIPLPFNYQRLLLSVVQTIRKAARTRRRPEYLPP